MKEIHLEQGTDDWLAWRKGDAFTDIFGVKHAALDGQRITATAASACGGHSPFATADQVWSEALGYRKRQSANFVMQRGSDMEPKARKAYSNMVGEEYEALCIESSTTPWIAASLDGVDLLRTRGVEIKCPISPTTHDMAMLGEVPNYYFDQIQWQMMASDNQLKEIDYFSFAPQIGHAPPITVKVDLQRQAELLDASLKLRLAIMTRVPLSGSEFEQAGKAFLVLNRRLKAITEELELAKDRVKTLANGKPTQGGGILVTVSKSDGRVSMEQVVDQLALRLNMDEKAVSDLKATCKGKPTQTISVKESADADAIYAEILSLDKKDTNFVEAPTEGFTQPHPVW
jgi:putative phage-type endonuclease